MTIVDRRLSAREIDTNVTASLADEGISAIYNLDDDKAGDLTPTVIVRQSIYAVCDVSHTDVDALACTFLHDRKVVLSDPHDIREIMEHIVYIVEAIGYEKEAEALVVELRRQFSKLEKYRRFYYYSLRT